MQWLLSLLGGGLVEKFTGPLERAWSAKLAADNDEARIAAEQDIARLEAARDIALSEAGRAWSATSVGRWLIVVPWGLWWASICAVSIINPIFGTGFVIHAMPAAINDMAKILVPAIVIADAGALVAGRIRR